MSLFIFWTTVGFVLAIIYSSFFEWTLHRFLMHQPVGRLTYPFERHALLHHRIFKADHTYHLIDEKDKWTIILNSQLKQWGAFSYEKYKDKNVLVATVPARKTKEVVEKFTIEATDNSINMKWENTLVSVPVKFEHH